MGVAVGDKVLLPECLLHSISLGILPLMFESSDNTERWFSRYGGQKITLGGDEYHLFREDDILVSTISGAHSSCVCVWVCATLLVADLTCAHMCSHFSRCLYPCLNRFLAIFLFILLSLLALLCVCEGRADAITDECATRRISAAVPVIPKEEKQDFLSIGYALALQAPQPAHVPLSSCLCLRLCVSLESCRGFLFLLFRFHFLRDGLPHLLLDAGRCVSDREEHACARAEGEKERGRDRPGRCASLREGSRLAAVHRSQGKAAAPLPSWRRQVLASRRPSRHHRDRQAGRQQPSAS